jgi:hypothetical protein
MAQPLDGLAQLARLPGAPAHSGVAVVENRGDQLVLPEITRSPTRTFLPGRTSASHWSGATCRSRTPRFPKSETGGPCGCACQASRRGSLRLRPSRPRGNDSGIVHDNQLIAREAAGQRAEPRVVMRCGCGRAQASGKHPRSSQRILSDALARKVEIEVGEQHRIKL